MRSIPGALTWELLQRGSWRLLLAALWSAALPVMLLSALRADGGLDPESESALAMQVVLLQLNVLYLGAALLSAQGNPSRLYAFPVRPATIVTWHLVPAGALLAALLAATTTVINALCGVNWPLWGPALLAAVALAMLQAVRWLTDGREWSVLALCAVAAVFALWHKSRYGAVFGPIEHPWNQLTSIDYAVLLAAAAAAWGVAVNGVARQRRGDALPELGVVAWLQRCVDAALAAERTFRTPAAAQFWYEWRQKGWILPTATVAGMACGVGGWLLSRQDPQELLKGFTAGGALLTIGGFVYGLVLGKIGAHESDLDVGHFVATRPMTTTHLVRAVLQTAGLSVLMAWALWAAAFLAVAGLVDASASPTGLRAAFLPPPALEWWYFPASLLGPWTAATLTATLLLTGRGKLIIGACVALVGTGLVSMVLSLFALPLESRILLGRFLIAACGPLFVCGTGVVYVAALRRGLIDAPATIAAGVAWLVLSTPIVVDRVLRPEHPVSLCAFAAGLLALAVAPWAAAPLALAWNRCR